MATIHNHKLSRSPLASGWAHLVPMVPVRGTSVVAPPPPRGLTIDVAQPASHEACGSGWMAPSPSRASGGAWSLVRVAWRTRPKPEVRGMRQAIPRRAGGVVSHRCPPMPGRSVHAHRPLENRMRDWRASPPAPVLAEPLGAPSGNGITASHWALVSRAVGAGRRSRRGGQTFGFCRRPRRIHPWLDVGRHGRGRAACARPIGKCCRKPSRAPCSSWRSSPARR
jgi:hypothetical protein